MRLLVSVFGPDSNLYVASANNDQVLRYNGATGAFIDAFASGGGLDSPTGLVFGPDGNLYVASTGSDQVLRYNGATGAFIDAFVTAGSGGLDEPIDLVFGPDGNLYVASANNDQVLRYNGATGAFIDVFASGGGLDEPVFLVFRDSKLTRNIPTLSEWGLIAMASILGIVGFMVLRKRNAAA